MEENLKLSAPWIKYYREIEALFGEDPDIKIVFDEETNTIKMYVDGQDKVDALEELLPMEKDFGNVTMYIEIIPSNKAPSKVTLFQKAFNGNPAFSFSRTVSGVFTNDISYIVFRNKVVQFFNDNLGDINGNESTLYQDIAEDVFGDCDGIFFCTDTENNLGMPLGELNYNSSRSV